MARTGGLLQPIDVLDKVARAFGQTTLLAADGVNGRKLVVGATSHQFCVRKQRCRTFVAAEYYLAAECLFPVFCRLPARLRVRPRPAERAR